MADKRYTLGISVNRHSVSASVIDRAESLEWLACERKELVPRISRWGEKPCDGEIKPEPGAPELVSSIDECMSRLPADLLRRVTKIGISGLVNFPVLWKDRAWEKVQKDGAVRLEAIRENVLTKHRFDLPKEFLETLPNAGNYDICYGSGTATIMWMARHEPEVLDSFTSAAHFQDFVVCMLCDLETPALSHQNSRYWGYFDRDRNEFDTFLLDAGGYPTRLVPKVAANEQIVGRLSCAWHGVPQGTVMGPATGDPQCSIPSYLDADYATCESVV